MLGANTSSRCDGRIACGSFGHEIMHCTLKAVLLTQQQGQEFQDSTYTQCQLAAGDQCVVCCRTVYLVTWCRYGLSSVGTPAAGAGAVYL
jgi:hypothetical protein